MSRYLVDTSTVIKYLNKAFPRKAQQFLTTELEKEIVISFITEIEMKSWNPADRSEFKIYLDFLSRCQIVGVSQEIIDGTASIRKRYKLKLPDAIIACTALVKNRVLISDNEKDFVRIRELNQFYPGLLK